ncbi:hypothetical protein ABPG75_004552 [Micractinium tetrahymenae]
MSTTSDLPSVSTGSGAVQLPAAAAATAGHAGRRPDGPGHSACRVPGCTEPLVGAYNQKYKICRTHFGAPSFRLHDGRPHRFCQQCSRIQPLEDFEGAKLSCREGLARHTQRRKERQARQAAGEPGGRPGGAAKRAPLAKRARQEAAAPSPRSSRPEEEATAGGSGSSESEDRSQGRRQRQRLSSVPADKQLPLSAPEPAHPSQPPLLLQPPHPPPPPQQHQQQEEQQRQQQQQQQQRLHTVLQLASQTYPLLTVAKPAPPSAAGLPLLAAVPRAAAQSALRPLPPPAPHPLAASPRSLPPLALLPPPPTAASRPLDSIPSRLLAPVTPHDSLTPEEPSPTSSEPLPPAQPGSSPRSDELLVRLLALALQRELASQPPQLPHAPASLAGFGFGGAGGSLSLSLPPPESPVGEPRRSAFRRWRPPAAMVAVAAGAAQPHAF